MTFAFQTSDIFKTSRLQVSILLMLRREETYRYRSDASILISPCTPYSGTHSTSTWTLYRISQIASKPGSILTAGRDFFIFHTPDGSTRFSCFITSRSTLIWSMRYSAHGDACIENGMDISSTNIAEDRSLKYLYTISLAWAIIIAMTFPPSHVT